jgi:hypothetical protein
MSYQTIDEANAARIPAHAAISEVARHGMSAYRFGRKILEVGSNDVIAQLDRHGDARGSDVLGWLGY